MLNVGGGEFLVILLVALIVLGPQKLPEAARQVAGVARELRRISAGFQRELKAAMDDPIEAAARERGKQVTSTEEQPAPSKSDPFVGSTAATAGMYNVAARAAAEESAETHDDSEGTATDDAATPDVEPAAPEVDVIAPEGEPAAPEVDGTAPEVDE